MPSSAESMLPDAIQAPSNIRQERLERFAEFVHLGNSRAEIARTMQIDVVTVDNWKRLPWVVDRLQKLGVAQETHVLLLKDRLRVEAQNILSGLLALFSDANTPSHVRAHIGMDLLDREGSISKKQIIEPGPHGGIFSDEQVSTVMDGLVEAFSGGRNGKGNGAP